LRLDVIILLVAAIVWLLVTYRRDRARQRAERNSFFDPCSNIFENVEIVSNGDNFPILKGKYRGLDISIEPIVDDLTVRKIPSLWLKLCLIAPVPYRGAIDILMRPRGNEIYSSIYDLDHELERPAGWPKDILIRCTDPAEAPPLSRLDSQLRLLNDPRCKEIVIAPRGVRLVYQGAQAQRADYSVLRHARFGAAPLAEGTVRELVRVLYSIYEAVREPQAEPCVTSDG
jgi:hypothetical protein